MARGYNCDLCGKSIPAEARHQANVQVFHHKEIDGTQEEVMSVSMERADCCEQCLQILWEFLKGIGFVPAFEGASEGEWRMKECFPEQFKKIATQWSERFRKMTGIDPAE